MIFHFIKAYYTSSENFKIDIPVSFVIPDTFKSLGDMSVMSSNNIEISNILNNLGITKDIRHVYKITKNRIIVNVKNPHFDSVRKILLRDKKLKELGL